MRKNVGFEENCGLGWFGPGFPNTLNREIERVKILWRIKLSKTVKRIGLTRCFKVT